MSGLLVALPGLGCAAMMVGMMWLMSRGNKQSNERESARPEQSSADHAAQLAGLSDEVDRLRAELRSERQEADPAP
jgi:hypothetical protein